MAFPDRSRLGRTLQALCLGTALLIAPSAFANTLPDIQRLMKEGQYPKALEKADAYLVTRPKDVQGRFLRGLILTEMNRSGDAIAVFTKLSEDYPELPEPYNNLAVIYAQQKQYDKARTALEMAIRTHPAYAVAYENLGDVYAKLASQAYDKALQLDSANTGTQNKLALIRDLVPPPGKTGAAPIPVATVAAAPAASVPVSTPAPAAAPVPAPAAQPAPTASKPAEQAKSPVATVVTSTPGAAAVVTQPSTQTAVPTPAATPPAPQAEVKNTANEQIAKALAGWANAWSKRNVKAYLGYYAPGFKPPLGMTRKAWEAERKERISRPSWIKVSYDTPKITLDGDTATVRFRQDYQASNFKSASSKTLVFTKSGNAWLILEEESR